MVENQYQQAGENGPSASLSNNIQLFDQYFDGIQDIFTHILNDKERLELLANEKLGAVCLLEDDKVALKAQINNQAKQIQDLVIAMGQQVAWEDQWKVQYLENLCCCVQVSRPGAILEAGLSQADGAGHNHDRIMDPQGGSIS